MPFSKIFGSPSAREGGVRNLRQIVPAEVESLQSRVFVEDVGSHDLQSVFLKVQVHQSPQRAQTSAVQCDQTVVPEVQMFQIDQALEGPIFQEGQRVVAHVQGPETRQLAQRSGQNSVDAVGADVQNLEHGKGQDVGVQRWQGDDSIHREVQVLEVPGQSWNDLEKSVPAEVEFVEVAQVAKSQGVKSGKSVPGNVDLLERGRSQEGVWLYEGDGVSAEVQPAKAGKISQKIRVHVAEVVAREVQALRKWAKQSSTYVTVILMRTLRMPVFYEATL